MAQDKIRIAGVDYDVPDNLTIGETLDIARELGAASDTDMGRAVGTAWIAVRRVHPKTTITDLESQPWEFIEGVPDDVDRLPPTNVAGSGLNGDETSHDPATAGSRGYGSMAEPNRET